MDIWSLIELERQIKKFKSIKELSEWVNIEINNEDKKMTKHYKETIGENNE
tara:strand:+ start:57 stop:209 length:153 start_codon:yes stop_codon:yes gene_type:complete